MLKKVITDTEIRTSAHLLASQLNYKSAWKDIELLRDGRGGEIDDWPEWCYIPTRLTTIVVAESVRCDSTQLSQRYPNRVADPHKLAGLAAWRLTQGIYRFEPSAYSAIANTRLPADLQTEVLFGLPEWCVYIETPDLLHNVGSKANYPLVGVFVHLEHNLDSKRPELRLILDVHYMGAPMLLPFVIPLDHPSLSQNLEVIVEKGREQKGKPGSKFSNGQAEFLEKYLEPLVSLALYLCSSHAEFMGPTVRPTCPKPTMCDEGERFTAPEDVTVWQVANQLGATLQSANPALSKLVNGEQKLQGLWQVVDGDLQAESPGTGVQWIAPGLPSGVKVN